MKQESEERKNVERDEEALARLLQLAGPRPNVPPDVEARVYEKVRGEWGAATDQPESARVYEMVHREWQQEKARPRIRRWGLRLALAASFLLALAVVLQSPPPEPDEVRLGFVARVVDDAGSGGLPAAGESINENDHLITAAGQRLSFLLNNTVSVRLDENSELVVDGRNKLHLLRGRVYADTGDFVYRDQQLVIDTPMGSVTDIGTQFAVSSRHDELDVAVREGRVDVSGGPGNLVAVAGERIRINEVDGATLDALNPYDSYWDWATGLAPAFEIENKSLFDFLRWAARETGRELVFEDEELRLSVMRTDLHGSISDFEPLEAVQSVLATTRFRYRIEASRIVIER